MRGVVGRVRRSRRSWRNAVSIGRRYRRLRASTTSRRACCFRWRRELGPARRSAEAKPAFVAVGLPAPVGTAVGNGGLIEIELAGGRRVRVAGAVDVVALRRVIEVLDGR